MSFTLFLPSTGGERVNANSSGEINYDFDWSTLRPEYNGEFELTFMFLSKYVPTNFNRNITPTMYWGSTHSTYEPVSFQQSNLSVANYTTALGNVNVIREDNLNEYVNYTTYAKQNVPVRISGLPTRNQFLVRFVDFRRHLPTPFLLGADWMMAIHFRAILDIPKQIQGSNNSFSLILNSRKGQALGDAPVLNSLTEFNVDWNALSKHKGRFRLSTCFATESLSTPLTGNTINKIEVDWGCIHNSFIATNDGRTDAITSQIIAMFRPVVRADTGGQYAYKRDQQVPIIISRLPSKNQFRTQFLRFDGQPIDGGFVTEWVLSLFFEAI